MTLVVPYLQKSLNVLLREHFRKLRAEQEKLSPAAQVVLIHVLLRVPDRDLKASALAHALGYSAMTLSRVFDELESTNLGESSRQGRERQLRLTSPKPALWAKAQPFLQSPVRRLHHAHRNRPGAFGPRAGLSALAQCSMLAEPDIEAVAMGRRQWLAELRADGLTEVSIREPGGLDVEVWSYDPGLLAEAGAVDPLSLYLSLRGMKDERIEAASDEMIRSVRWP